MGMGRVRRVVRMILLLTTAACFVLDAAGGAREFETTPAVPLEQPGLLLQAGPLRVLSIASADFDADGVPDLACGYSGPGGHFVAIHPGNVDSIFPSRLEARLRRAQGTAVATPFGAALFVRRVKERPDFLAAGDFDADDRWDVVVAERGSGMMHFLAGRGASGLQEPAPWPVGGAITALVEGQINRADPLADLVVGVDHGDGHAALVFEGPEGARRASVERFALPAAADALALGQLVDDRMRDLVVAAGRELIVIAGRDRRLTSTSEARATVPPARQRRVPLDGRVEALTIRDSLSQDGDYQPELLALFRDGTLRLVTSDGPSRTTTTAPPPAALQMRLNADARPDLVQINADGEIEAAITAIASTITVNSLADTAVAGDGECTLREAILNSNDDNDTTGGDCATGSGDDMIAFSIGGGGTAASIAPVSELPAIWDSTTIDGDTQACPDPPCIELDGSGTSSADGLEILADDCVVRGLAIHSFDLYGITAGADWIVVLRTIVEGNTIGLDRLGTAVRPNGRSGIRHIESSRKSERKVQRGSPFSVIIVGANQNDQPEEDPRCERNVSISEVSSSRSPTSRSPTNTTPNTKRCLQFWIRLRSWLI